MMMMIGRPAQTDQAWHNDERGLPKADRPHARPFGSEAGQDHLRLLASPASRTKAGTPGRAGGQVGGGAALRSDGIQGQVENLTLKIYDKGGRVLRIEVVVHNVKDLRSGKVLDKLNY